MYERVGKLIQYFATAYSYLYKYLYNAFVFNFKMLRINHTKEPQNLYNVIPRHHTAFTVYYWYSCTMTGNDEYTIYIYIQNPLYDDGQTNNITTFKCFPPSCQLTIDTMWYELPVMVCVFLFIVSTPHCQRATATCGCILKLENCFNVCNNKEF